MSQKAKEATVDTISLELRQGLGTLKLAALEHLYKHEIPIMIKERVASILKPKTRKIIRNDEIPLLRMIWDMSGDDVWVLGIEHYTKEVGRYHGMKVKHKLYTGVVDKMPNGRWGIHVFTKCIRCGENWISYWTTPASPADNYFADVQADNGKYIGDMREESTVRRLRVCEECHNKAKE